MNEKKYTYLFYCAVIVAIVYLFSGQYEHEQRLAEVKQQLDTVRANQQQLSEQIKSASTTNTELAGDLETGAGQASEIADTNRSIASDINEAGRIIDECQQIVERLQRADEKGDKRP